MLSIDDLFLTLEQVAEKVSYLEKAVDDFQKEKLELLSTIEELKNNLGAIPEEYFENKPKLVYIIDSYNMLENGNFIQKAESIFRLVYSALKS